MLAIPTFLSALKGFKVQMPEGRGNLFRPVSIISYGFDI